MYVIIMAYYMFEVHCIVQFFIMTCTLYMYCTSQYRSRLKEINSIHKHYIARKQVNIVSRGYH